MADAYKCDICGKVFEGPSGGHDLYFHPYNDKVGMSVEYYLREQKKKPDVCPECRKNFIKLIADELEKEGLI